MINERHPPLEEFHVYPGNVPKDGSLVWLYDAEVGVILMQWDAQRQPMFSILFGCWVAPDSSVVWNDHDPDAAPSHWAPYRRRLQ